MFFLVPLGKVTFGKNVIQSSFVLWAVQVYLRLSNDVGK